MTNKNKLWCRTLGLTLSLLVLLLGGAAAVQAEVELPASTFLPFDGQHAMALSGASGERWIYPYDQNYLQVGYQQDSWSGERDLVVQKLDQDGKVQWKQVYKRNGQDTLVVLHTQKNGFVLGMHNQQQDKKVVRVLQCDGNGEVVWQRDLPMDRITAIASTNDQGIIVAGVTNGNIHLVKMDEKGIWQNSTRNTKQWERVYQDSGSQYATQIIQLLDEDEYNDGYILTGATDSSTNGGKDVYMMRLDAYGDVKWSRNFGTERDDEGITLAVMADEDDVIMGFVVAGNTVNKQGDMDLYLIYVDKYGHLQSWPGYQYAPDGRKERTYGGAGDQRAIAFVPVPDSFKDDRKWFGEDIEGHGGAVLVGVDVDDEEVLIVRFDEAGHVLWEKTLDIPGESILIGTLTTEDDEVQYLAYSVTYPGNQGQNLNMYALKLYLEGVIEDEDKTIPKDDQEETNHEAVTWEKRTLKYEALRDIGKEIKDLLAQQPYRPLTAGSGWGEIEWPDLSYYLGPITVGKADGEGTLLFKNGVWYKGQWKDNMFNGTGMLRFPTGEVYEGQFKDHMMHGQGTFTWPTGERYTGEFKYNQRDGKGVFTWPGGVVYEGDFVKDQAHGQGVIRWPNGERYEGQMTSGQATGQGSYYFPSGEWYRGEIQNLTFSGVGVYHWPDGSYFVGQFQNDRLYGEGYYVWPNGVQQWGYWKDDRYMGTHEEAMETRNRW